MTRHLEGSHDIQVITWQTWNMTWTSQNMTETRLNRDNVKEFGFFFSNFHKSVEMSRTDRCLYITFYIYARQKTFIQHFTSLHLLTHLLTTCVSQGWFRITQFIQSIHSNTLMRQFCHESFCTHHFLKQINKTSPVN